MQVFNPANETSADTIRLNNNKYFTSLANPCMYIDPSLVVPLPAPAGGTGTPTGGGGSPIDGTGDPVGIPADDGDTITPVTVEQPDPPMDESSMGIDPNIDSDRVAAGAADPVI